MTRYIDADAVYKILVPCEIIKATIGNPLTDWEDGYTCGIERAESEIECAPTVDAIPIEWIKKRIEDLDEYISKWGGVFEQEAVVNAKIHEVGGLMRLIADWSEEVKEE